MEKRTSRFLAPDKIDHDGEIFDYINELHDYLWRFVRIVYPGASGNVSDWVDKTIIELEERHGKTTIANR